MAFIVLEGLDGAGKSTQIEMLEQHIKSAGGECVRLHFPRFDAPVYGDLIARFLRGEFGSVSEVNPYLVALLYAGDRAEAAGWIRERMAEGKTVIADRYVYSNIGYQCAKLKTAEERKALSDWIFDLEFAHFGIPRPDRSLFLDVPFKFTEGKLTAARCGGDRAYLNGCRDIHEQSLDLQRTVREVYLDAATRDVSLRVIDCGTADGNMASPEGIFAKIRTALNDIL